MRGYLADLQVSSDIVNAYDHYKMCNQIFDKHNSKNNLILLNESIHDFHFNPIVLSDLIIFF